MSDGYRNSSGDVVALEALIRGRVQGVGFRHFTRQTAQRLGVSGFVRNESDGSVVVVAEGPARAMEAFVSTLRDGPPGAEVTDLDLRPARPTGEYDRFEVRFR